VIAEDSKMHELVLPTRGHAMRRERRLSRYA